MAGAQQARPELSMSEQKISPERLGAWIRSWDTGLSSEAIFHYMTLGIKGGATPADPSDLGRCLRLLECFPEWKPRMVEMSDVSKEWALLIPHWSAIEASFLAEAGGSLPGRCQNWSAPATYEMMRDVFYFRKDGMLFSRAAFPDEQVPA